MLSRALVRIWPCKGLASRLVSRIRSAQTCRKKLHRVRAMRAPTPTPEHFIQGALAFIFHLKPQEDTHTHTDGRTDGRTEKCFKFRPWQSQPSATIIPCSDPMTSYSDPTKQGGYKISGFLYVAHSHYFPTWSLFCLTCTYI